MKPAGRDEGEDRQVWLVAPKKRSVEVFRSAAASRLLTFADTIEGGDLLRGFSLPVADIFRF